jgi:effector protein LidA
MYWSIILPTEAVFDIQPSGSLKTLSLTSSQLEKWCANIERGNKPNTHTDSYLATQFLSRYGLKNPIDVIEFLKTAAGKTVFELIGEELARIDALNKSLAEQFREEMLMREKIMVFILMGAIAQREEQAKYVAEITQQQIDQKLKENKQPESTSSTPYAKEIAVLDASIKSYTEAINALDTKEKELEKDLKKIEKMLQNIDAEGAQLALEHAITNAHLDQLSAYLQLPLFSQPEANYIEHANQQIASLTTQLAALRVQHAARNTIAGTVATELDKESNTSRKIRMLEEQLAFHHHLVKQPPQSGEEIYQQLFDQVCSQLSAKESLFANQTIPMHHRCEVDGLRLQKHGLHQALQVRRKEKILLNDQLEEVNDFSQACFIIEPSHKSRYKKHGDSYAIFEENVDPDNLSEKDLLQAKLNFDRLKSDVRVVHSHCKEQMQQQVGAHQERREHHQKTRDKYIDQISEIKASKVELLKGLSSAKAQKELLKKKTHGANPQQEETLEPVSKKQESLSPKPSPKLTPKLESQSSYSLMMKNFECLAPAKGPAPAKEDIEHVCHELEAIIPVERQEALKELIDEVHPGELMTPDTRLSWLQRAKSLIPRPDNTPEPELDLSPGFRGMR